MTAFMFRSHDLTLAVKAHSMLCPYLIKSPKQFTVEERRTLIWRPIKLFLTEFVEMKPAALGCIYGESDEYPANSGGQLRNVFTVRPDKAVAYIGTVFNRRAEEAYRRKWIDLYTERKRDDLARQLRAYPPTTIMTDRMFCRIPMMENNLTNQVMTSAVRRYLAQEASSLSRLPIRPWPAKRSDIFCQEIRRLAAFVAAKEAPTQTEDEKNRIVLEDEFRLL